MSKIKIGITIGDINGIGAEVIIRSLMNKKMLDLCIPIIYGSSKVLSYYKNIMDATDFQFSNITDATRPANGKINVINCWEENVNIEMGKASADSGKYAHIALDRAFNDVKAGHIDAVVTAPINKAAMKLVNFPYPGHTEFFTEKLNESSLMTMVADDLRVALVTNHLPLKDVADKVNKETILKKLKIFNDSLTNDFGIQKPTIAVLGLNPHAGDEGAIGSEEQDIVRPVIIEAKKSGMMTMGPYSADGFFGSSQFQKVDGILAMYHDQGLVPFKAITFGTGVNVTTGLSIVRTSPDHGTAYDIVGKNKADGSSMRSAIYTAIDIVRSRKDWADMTSNTLVRRETRSIERTSKYSNKRDKDARPSDKAPYDAKRKEAKQWEKRKEEKSKIEAKAPEKTSIEASEKEPKPSEKAAE